MVDINLQIGLLFLAALAISFIIRVLKQPTIIGYILAGILISPFLMNMVMENDIIFTLSEFGITFLLFIVGLHLNPKVIREAGFASLIVGLIQIIFTSCFGFLIAKLLDFSILSSFYIAFALTFSSTVIVTKLLSDKSDLESLYGKISIGILILQDIVVMLLLVILPYFSKDITQTLDLYSILYLLITLSIIIFSSIFVLPGITKFVAKNQELLFLFAIAWCFFIASIFFKLGFSMEIGALIAGMSLSLSPYHTEISCKIRPLRDFFLIIFFILLGLQTNITSINEIIKPALIFSLFVIFFKLFIILIPLGILGYTKRTSFLAGISLGQISEFSFVMASLGVSLGHISTKVLSVITLTGLITIASSTYFITHANYLFNLLSKPLNIFERKKIKERVLKKKSYKYVLFGYNRIGFSILKAITKLKGDYIVVDFNPETIKKLKIKGVECVYGDAEDTELLNDLKIEKAKLIISTVPDFETNSLILNKIRKENQDSIVVLTARQISEAFKLYEAGADYLILPHFLGGEYTSKIIEKFKTSKKRYEKEKIKQIKILEERLEEGHEHPFIEKNHR